MQHDRNTADATDTDDTPDAEFEARSPSFCGRPASISTRLPAAGACNRRGWSPGDPLHPRAATVLTSSGSNNAHRHHRPDPAAALAGRRRHVLHDPQVRQHDHHQLLDVRQAALDDMPQL